LCHRSQAHKSGGCPALEARWAKMALFGKNAFSRRMSSSMDGDPPAG
jgi:hypothetical protein